MIDIHEFINQSIKYGGPINFTKMVFRKSEQVKDQILICRKYETKKLRSSEFHKAITCFHDYLELKNVVNNKSE